MRLCTPFLLLLLLQLLMLHRKAIARRRKCPGSLSEDKIIREVFHNYTKKLPDSEHADESVHVEIEMHVQDMGSLNEISADFEIDVLFTQLWHDPSLSFINRSSECVRNITMESRFLKDIWMPNTCIINAKRTSVHASPTDNIMFILYENGTVWINHRLSVKAPCDLDLRTFPFDTQTCKLQLESYSHNSDEVSLHWMAEPITMMKPIQLPDFDMIQFDTRRETLLYPNGYWNQLEASFTFKRRYGFYILQAYVPTYLTIIVSWVGFCMEPKALPARTTVGVSSLLALTLQFGNIHKNLPRVSYVKAMDVWMLGCISFVFGTMIELAIVCYITRCQSAKRSKANRQHKQLMTMLNNNCSSFNSFPPAPPSSHTRRSLSALLAAAGDPPEQVQSCLEANLLGLLGEQTRSNSMRLTVRNGGLPGQQQPRRGSNTSAASSHGPFHFARRRKRRTAAAANGGTPNLQQTTALLMDEEQRTPVELLPPSTPQLLLPTLAETGLLGNGGLPSPTQLYKSASAAPSLGTPMERRSVHIAPDQLTPIFPFPGRPLALRPSSFSHRRRSSAETEENWPIIQPESIDKLSIVVFPLAFTLFNLIYWWYYLSLGGQFGRFDDPPPVAAHGEGVQPIV